MSVCPAAETFWTIMSMLMPGVRERPEDAARRRPGWSGTPRIVTFASPVSCAMPEMIACSSTSSSFDDPGALLVGERRADVDRHSVVASVLDRPQHQHARAARRQLEHLLVRDRRQLAGVRHDARVGREDAVDVGVDLADVRVERGGERDGGRVGAAAAERRHVRRRSRRPGSRRRSRSCPRRAPRARGRARISTIRALPWLVSVTIPACEPVNEIASRPRSLIAIETSAIEIRSPAVSSMSISRGCGSVETCARELDELVGRVAHRRDDDADLVPGRGRLDDAARDALDLARGARRRCRRTSGRSRPRRGNLPSGRAGKLRGVIRDEPRGCWAWEERHQRLIARMLVAAVLTLIVDVVGTLLIWQFERHAPGTDIQTLGDALFFTTVQLLTVSSQLLDPLTIGGAGRRRLPRDLGAVRRDRRWRARSRRSSARATSDAARRG